jgi:hypothetical protein
MAEWLTGAEGRLGSTILELARDVIPVETDVTDRLARVMSSFTAQRSLT